MLFRPNAKEFTPLKISPHAKEFVPASIERSVLAPGAKEFVPSSLAKQSFLSPFAKEFKPSPSSPLVRQKSSLVVSSTPGLTKKLQPLSAADPHFCYATITYYVCGCRAREPVFFCKPNFHTRNKNSSPATPGFNPCQHERISIVVGCVPSACAGSLNTSAACMAPDPAMESFTREIDTANRFIVHFTLGTCLGAELQAALPLKTNGGPSSLEDEVRRHYQHWQDPSAPEPVSGELPVEITSEEMPPQDSKPITQKGQEEEEIQSNTEAEETSKFSEETGDAPENKEEAPKDDKELVEDETKAPVSTKGEEQGAEYSPLEDKGAKTDVGDEYEMELIDSKSLVSVDEPEGAMFKPEEIEQTPEDSSNEPDTAVTPRPEVKSEELVAKSEEPVIEPELTFEPEELGVKPEEFVLEPEESTVETEVLVKPDGPTADIEEPVLELQTAVEHDGLSEESQKLEESVFKTETLPVGPDTVFELEEPTDELVELEDHSEDHKNGSEEKDTELGESEDKFETEYSTAYEAQYSAYLGAIDYGFDAYDGYDGSDDSDSDSDDSHDSDDSDDSGSDDSDSEDSDSGDANTTYNEYDDRIASDMLDLLESCETFKELNEGPKKPEPKPVKKFWSKLSFRVFLLSLFTSVIK